MKTNQLQDNTSKIQFKFRKDAITDVLCSNSNRSNGQRTESGI